MFLSSLNVYFMFGYACFKFICLKTAIWRFLGQVVAFLVKTGWQPCMLLRVLSEKVLISRFVERKSRK